MLSSRLAIFALALAVAITEAQATPDQTVTWQRARTPCGSVPDASYCSPSGNGDTITVSLNVTAGGGVVAGSPISVTAVDQNGNGGTGTITCTAGTNSITCTGTKRWTGIHAATDNISLQVTQGSISSNLYILAFQWTGDRYGADIDHPVTVPLTLGTIVHDTHWHYAIHSTCPAVHTIELAVDGITTGLQSTSGTAGPNNESIATIDVTLSENTPQGAGGKPWVVRIDGSQTYGGVIQWASGVIHALNTVNPQDEPRFDCLGSCTGIFNGSVMVKPRSKVHTLTLLVNGGQVASKASIANQSITQPIVIKATVPGLVSDGPNPSLYEWRLDDKTTGGARPIDKCQ